MEGKADLHVHTVFSDGSLSPGEVVRMALEAGVTTISITDHDSVEGIAAAQAVGIDMGVEVIPGVEMSVTVDNEEVHLLGYFVDTTDGDLSAYLEFARSNRFKRAEMIVEKLNHLNIPLRFESVLRQAGTASVGRPHIATALFDEGLTASYHEAFYKYIGNGKPAYQPKHQVTPRHAMELISSVGGLSFVAHPGNSLSDKTLKALIDQGLDGIEVVHPSHSPTVEAHYRKIANEYFLLMSGGSDFHGGQKNHTSVFGKYTIPLEQVDMMRSRL